MVITKTLIRNCSTSKSPKVILETVNNKLCENNETNMFVSALMGFYNIKSGKFVFVSAGHNPPLVKRGGKDYEFLRNEPCLVLGCMENAVYNEEEIMLEPGDAIYLYTDGVTEAMNANRDLFSEELLLEVMKKYKDSPPRELLFALKQEIDDFAGDAEQADDITMLALKVECFAKEEFLESVLEELE
jgi:sigma-B regulation protein RsbU (phosphoserine phosphatase)